MATYCRGERRTFDDDQFENRPGWGLCHVKGVESPHTVSGTTIKEGVIELPDLALPEGEEAPGGEW